MRRSLTLLAAAGALALPAAAAAHDEAPVAAMAAITAPCPGKAIVADRVVTGSFGSEQQGSYVMVPFTVPDGTTAVRVKYCFDQPESPTSAQVRHTLDLGLYEPRRKGSALWGPRELRGWGGSSHPDVTLSAEGFGGPQGTTRAFLPGPVRDGQWAVELGLAAIAGRDLGDRDGRVEWRVEIDLIDDPAFADEPYEPAPYRRRPVRRDAGWYKGDLHVHGEHSALNDAPMKEVFDYAFGPAGLDFITLSDYVGGASWDEIGRHQAAYPEKLIVRSAEVITYRGHVNNHANATTVDYRTGPILERGEDGNLAPRRDASPASRLLEEIREAGGITQLNHVTIFPNEVPLFALMCRGCPWDYTAEETDWSLVDAIEVATGPGGVQPSEIPGGLGPNPFTATAIDFYEDALASGEHIAAVGSSDSHQAGRRNNAATQSPIGQATTVAYAPELSEEGMACAVKRGHTYVKVFGADRPDLRLEATAPGVTGTAIFGDTIRADGVRMTARVLGASPIAGQPFSLLVVKDGAVQSIHPVSGDAEVTFAAPAPGRYGLRLMRGTSIEAISTPVWVEAPGSGPAGIQRPACDGIVKRERASKRAAAQRRKAMARRAKALRRALR